jgi:hypothetical protein
MAKSSPKSKLPPPLQLAQPQKKQAILLVHGMGKNSPPKDGQPGSFGQEFITTTTTLLQSFAAHKSETIADYLDIYEFNYDAWFDKMRTEMADRAKPMADRLSAIGGLHGIDFGSELVTRLTAWEAQFDGDDFFHTHWLDVIFYGTLLGAKVRVDAARHVDQLVQAYQRENVHIIAHSLGTAVIHDTLHLLYRPEADPKDEIADLSPTNERLASIWMFANVSRLVNTVTRLADTLSSVVKPGGDGCTDYFYNIRHKLDPFTMLARFDPQNNGTWIPGNIFATRYTPLVTELIVEVNTHSFPRYLQDPKVVWEFLPNLLGEDFEGTKVEFDAYAEKYAKGSLDGAYGALEDAFTGLTTDITSWQPFLDAAKTFTNEVKTLGGTI